VRQSVHLLFHVVVLSPPLPQPLLNSISNNRNQNNHTSSSSSSSSSSSADQDFNHEITVSLWHLLLALRRVSSAPSFSSSSSTSSSPSPSLTTTTTISEGERCQREIEDILERVCSSSAVHHIALCTHSLFTFLAEQAFLERPQSTRFEVLNPHSCAIRVSANSDELLRPVASVARSSSISSCSSYNNSSSTIKIGNSSDCDSNSSDTIRSSGVLELLKEVRRFRDGNQVDEKDPTQSVARVTARLLHEALPVVCEFLQRRGNGGGSSSSGGRGGSSDSDANHEVPRPALSSLSSQLFLESLRVSLQQQQQQQQQQEGGEGSECTSLEETLFFATIVDGLHGGVSLSKLLSQGTSFFCKSPLETNT
jgi:hypothetical protein